MEYYVCLAFEKCIAVVCSDLAFSKTSSSHSHKIKLDALAINAIAQKPYNFAKETYINMIETGFAQNKQSVVFKIPSTEECSNKAYLVLLLTIKSVCENQNLKLKIENEFTSKISPQLLRICKNELGCEWFGC